MIEGILITTGALLASFVITFKAVPSIIYISEIKRHYDEPDGERKIHRNIVPTLGGIALFAGFLIACGTFFGQYSPDYLSPMVASLLILFFIGIKDDILVLSSKKKLAGQIIAAGIIVFAGGIKVPGLDGLFGITHFPPYAGEFFSIFAIVIIINAYNLIDGVDGLAGMISLAGALIFGVWFLAGGHYAEAILCFSLVGALVGFLLHNFEPAKIFMGDTGSQLIGFVLAVAGFRLIELNAVTTVFILDSPAVFVFSVMIIPMFDTIRVIAIRVYRGISPLRADSRHIHHVMLRLGLSHSSIALTLTFLSLVIVASGLYLNLWSVYFNFLVLLGMAASILPLIKLVVLLSSEQFSHAFRKPDLRMFIRVLQKTLF